MGSSRGIRRGALLVLLLLASPAARGEPRPKPDERDHHVGADKHHHHHRHHTGHHRFRDAERWSRVFDNPKRDRWQRPARVVDKLKLEPSMRVADIGAGTGYFTVRLARRVSRGTVYAVDVEQTMVAHIRRRARNKGLKNVVALRGKPDDPRLPRRVDLVFLCDTYHHIRRRTRYFAALRDKIKRGGRLVVVDFKMGKIPVGPPPGHRIAPAQVQRELSNAGYRRVELDRKTLPYQYIATYRTRRPARRK